MTQNHTKNKSLLLLSQYSSHLPFKKYIYHESHTHLHTLKYTHNIPKETLGITSGFFTSSPGALSVFLEKKKSSSDSYV